jgi:hypothetical protein
MQLDPATNQKNWVSTGKINLMNCSSLVKRDYSKITESAPSLFNIFDTEESADKMARVSL